MSDLHGVGGVPFRCRSDVSRELFVFPDICAVATYVAPTTEMMGRRNWVYPWHPFLDRG